MFENETPKNEEYECILCAFKCSDKSKYTRHLSTAKHQKGVQKQEIFEQGDDCVFTCIACNFMCNYKSDYDRHMTTEKHMSKVNSNALFEKRVERLPLAEKEAEKRVERLPLAEKEVAPYSCDCGKTYTSRSSLWYHKKRCYNNNNNNEISDESEKVNRVLPVSHTFLAATPVTFNPESTMQSMMFDFMKSQAERDDKRYEAQSAQAQVAQAAQAAQAQAAQAQAAQAAATAEQTRLLIEAISLNGMQCITNNNTTNNQFNLNVFLNEDCKDAYTLKEVAESIECTVSDLDRMDKDGYAATITRKILESIENMSITERPIHCTDARRNAVCVKEETGWEKNEMALKSLNSTIFLIGNKIHGMMDDWRAKYPEHRHGSESHRKQYHRLVMEVIKVSDRVTESHIVSKVCNGVILDRKAAMR